MRIRFTMRDFIWLLGVAGVATAWGIDRYWHGLIDKENKRLQTEVSAWVQYYNAVGPQMNQLQNDVRSLNQSISRLESSKDAAK